MSRATSCRDAVKQSLQSTISVADDRIESFLVANYNREELLTPRVGVRLGGRDIEIGQAIDERLITIEVGVMGVISELDDGEATTLTSVRSQAITSADAIDNIVEEILALWTPAGVLINVAMAEHVFHSITQPAAFDAKQLYDSGVYVSIIQIQFRDSEDN